MTNPSLGQETEQETIGTQNPPQILQLKEELNDMVILTYLVTLATGAEDAWKLMKLSFLFDREAFEKKEYGLNAEFFSYDQGAYSKQISQLRNKLVYSHFFTDVDVHASLSTKGYEHLERIEELIEFKKTKAFDTLESIVAEYKNRGGRELMDLHYNKIVKGKKVNDYKMYDTILSKSDFQDQKSFVENLPDEKIYELYLRFLFPETYNRDDLEILPKEYNSIDEFISDLSEENQNKK